MAFKAPAAKQILAKPKAVAAMPAKPVPTPPPEPKRPPAQEIQSIVAFCTWCGMDVDPDSTVCMHCHRDLKTGLRMLEEPVPESDYEPYQEPSAIRGSHETPGPSIAGLMLTLGGILALGQGLIFMVTGESLGGFSYSGANVGCCGGIIFFLGLCGIIGGKFSSERKHMYLVLAACVGIALTFTFYVVGPFIGIIALILVWESRFDFENW